YEGGSLRNYTTSHGLSDNVIFTFAEDLSGNRWIGTAAGGAMKLVRGGFTAFGEPDGFTRGGIVSISETVDGELSVVTFGGKIHLFDGQQFKRVLVTLPPAHYVTGDAGREHYPAIQDRRGQWWIAGGTGIQRFTGVRKPSDLARVRAKAV